MKALFLSTAAVLVLTALGAATFAGHSNAANEDTCNFYPTYTGGHTGGDPAPANGTRGPVVPAECQRQSR